MKYLLLATLLLSGALLAQNPIHIDITTDNYPGETSWELTGDSGLIDAETNFNLANNTYATVINDLADGTYTFTIFDSFGDGICCSYGNGSFSVFDDNTSSVIAAGGDFGDEFSVTFDLPYVPPTPGCTDPTAYNYDSTAEIDDGSCLYLQSDPTIDIVLFASGFDDPVDIANAGDDRLFVVEKDGAILILNPDGTTNPVPFIDIDPLVLSGGERGLLGMTFHPDYDNNGFFFVHYTNNSGTSTLARYTVSVDPDVANPLTAEIILTQSQPYSNHNAGAIHFGPDGYLYIPFGDGGSGGDPQNYGQNNSSWLGKMLRIDVDNGLPYTVPVDNPFVGDPGVLDEIWSTGLRNPWRFAFDALTGDMYIADVGQGNWEEVDVEVAGDPGGHNYGWRCYEGNHAYNTTGCVDESELTWPVFEYNHSGGACSVTGGYVYRGQDYANLDGLYIFTDYCNGLFRGIRQVEGIWLDYELTGPEGFGWSTFGEDYLGEMYVANVNGMIYKIEDPCAGLIAEISGDENLLTATAGDSYIWTADGVILPLETNQTLVPSVGVTYQVSVSDGTGCTDLSDPFTVEADCQVDVAPNGVVDVLDLVMVSSNFGCTGVCNGDANGDGIVNVLDLVAISSFFGYVCP